MTDSVVDINKVDDVNLLKAMAYDRLVGLETLQGELQVINARIRELLELAPSTNGNRSQRRAATPA